MLKGGTWNTEQGTQNEILPPNTEREKIVRTVDEGKRGCAIDPTGQKMCAFGDGSAVFSQTSDPLMVVWTAFASRRRRVQVCKTSISSKSQKKEFQSAIFSPFDFCVIRNHLYPRQTLFIAADDEEKSKNVRISTKLSLSQLGSLKHGLHPAPH